MEKKEQMFSGFVEVIEEEGRISAATTEKFHKTLDSFKAIEEVISFYRAFEAGFRVRLTNSHLGHTTEGKDFVAYRVLVASLLNYIEHLSKKRKTRN